LGKCRPLPNEPNERMGHTPPGRKLMEDCTSWNPDEFLPIFGALYNRIVRSFVMGKIVVPLFHGVGVVGFVILRCDGVWAFGPVTSWNSDFAFFTRGDEVTKVSPVCTIEPVFQSLVKK